MKTIKGISYINSQGEKIESYCLLMAEHSRYAIAMADFKNGQLERFDSSKNYQNIANEWLSNLKKSLK